MKYWGFLVAKLVAASLLLAGLWTLVEPWLPRSEPFLNADLPPMGHDLAYTSAVWLFGLFAVGLLYLIALDQKYRCRSCLRRLRMPLARGSWNRMLLLGKPHTEYICPYGHGTLKVPEVHFTGKEPLAWAEHQDIWKELELIESGRR
ncbi:MAG: hypothetical protein NZV14_08490 [Bryobacteraceae bacterium]|nr:hypothetical protein [Bryobacteraceae bacterium]MDW8378186.1 hypothetical protein [Bryobacterales bacterium]